ASSHVRVLEGQILLQACLRPRERFWDIPVPKIDSAFGNLSLIHTPLHLLHQGFHGLCLCPGFL
ncbi:hypothetical protein, partial [Thiolapillus sp.]|uniref:hypothetical protein n=1 Tax=Thiolapillus sp. TaxID=2017437 RepID=UPI003AF954C7